ncbi:TRAP transporter large permease [Thermodesulfobacteriota bacterium]
MSGVAIGLIAFVILFILLAFGYEIGFSMFLIGFGGAAMIVGVPAAGIKLANIAFDTVSTYLLATLPLFMLMANVCFASGIGSDLYNVARKWLGHYPGGIAIASVGACAGFAAVSASSIATAVTMGLVALPEMKKLNYDPALATGSVAAGGSMGALIPPSGMLIVYGILTETSIGQLFMAGIIPGFLEALFYMIVIFGLCIWKPSLGPRGPKFSIKEKILSIGTCGETIALIFLVLGGLIIGWFTPTEAGAIGAFGAIVFASIRRRLPWAKFKEALFETMKSTGFIFCILMGAHVLNYFLALTMIPYKLGEFVSSLPISPILIMACICLVYLVLGCVMDAAAMITLSLPIFVPLIESIGYDKVFFGIIVVRAMEMALITPPIGVNVYVISGIAPDVPMETIFKGIFPFLAADIVHVIMLLLFPAIALWLPSLLY